MKTRRTGLTKDEVLAALRVCAKKLGHVPTRKEFRKLAGISEKVVSNRFGSYGKALREAGFDPVGPGHQWSDDRLLLDWAAVARKLKKIPTKDEYTANSRHSTTPFDSRWKSWREVGPVFVEHARSARIEDEWADVVAMVEEASDRIVGTKEHREELIGLKSSGDRVIRGSGDRKSRNAQVVEGFRRKGRDYRGSTRMGADLKTVLPQPSHRTPKGKKASATGLTPGCSGAGPSPSTLRRYARSVSGFGMGPSGGESLGRTGEHGRGRLFSGQSTQRQAGRRSEGKFENRKLKRLRLGKTALKPGKAVYGPRLDWPGMIFAPMCEDGVIFAFGMVAHRLGFEILRIRKAFPDCEAMREVQPGRWQHTWIEFEQESRNFVKHGHKWRKCDLIVCWVHNWKECPLEVIELRNLVIG